MAKVYEVEKNTRHPKGVKAKFILLDIERNVPRLLVDNHAPFGFHIHTRLPDEKDYRIELPTDDFLEAYDEFLNEVERIVKNES